MASMLEENRILSKVQTSKMSLLLYSGQDRLDSLRRIWNKIEGDPEFDKSERLNMNHAERYVDACRKIKRFQEIADEENFQTLDEMYDAYMAVDENLPIDVHLSMFIPIMTLHTSPEQKERWLEAAKTFRIIGAYAQTELAHGSNVRGIETTAIYDIDTDEFVINTPSLTSAKWWPGGLGHTATHAIVYANLILKKKNFGPHPFMVQLRSLKDHTPLPNMKLGDLGPKQGYNSMDNGFAIFDNIRIPRMDMLMGFAYVSSSGEYSKKEGAEKIAFGIMLDVRARICMNSAYVLARVLTISIRYSCVRVQGFVDPSGRIATERSVLDYPTQQRVLMPLLAFAYALHFTGEDVKRFYSSYTVSGDASVLSELHASSAGLKSYITAHVSEGMEACRKMCGGHGFLVNAGFAELYTSYLPFSTLEGTKEVLQQQTGRFLLKQYILALKVFHTNEKNVLQSKNGPSPMAPSTEYLLECLKKKKQKESKINFSFLLQILEKNPEDFTNKEYAIIEEELLYTNQIRSSWCVVNSAIVVEKSKNKQTENKKSNPQKNIPETKNTEIEKNSVWDQNFNSRLLDPLLSASVELCVAAESHSELLILQSFANKLKKQISLRSTDEKTLPVNSYNTNKDAEGGEESNKNVLEEERVCGAELHALRLLFLLLSINTISKNSGQYLASGAIQIADFPIIGEIESMLCKYIRTDSLNLIEAWMFSDQRLASTLGRSDGKVYEALYECALKEPLNRVAVSEGYTRYLKHVIDRPHSDGSNGLKITRNVSRL